MPMSKNRRGTVQSEDSPEVGPSKKDKYISSDEEDEITHKKGDRHQSSKMYKQCGTSKKSPGFSKQTGGHGTHNKPAELFRKDLISAMKLADTEILYDDEYFIISDPWRQEWEKGVQVPVNEDEIPSVSINEVNDRGKAGDFKVPPKKYLHEKNDETYQGTIHELTGMQELAEQIVRYDLDDQDVMWLDLVNEDREEMGLQLINEWNLERMIEELENQCYVKTNAMKKTEEGLGIEYDEDIACDVCRMLESEDTNEMVFCDGCDICVHQACYGIQTIPEGSWLCRICALGIKPMCLLCPKRGGAMKSTRSGTKWTHVSCALWIPEVSIGCPEKMEPITKISNIPASRWALVCCLCKERVGACIQCSVKQCKTAFHVTCGFAHNLDMKTILDDSDELDGIHLRAYCPKHTKNRHASDSESPKMDEDEENENDINEAEMAKQRAEKLKQLDEEFYTLVDIDEIASKFYIPLEAVDVVAEYWKLKRKVNDNKPLITPKMEEEDQMQKQQKDSLSARMKMFVHLRQDLERARNLCYMIGKREKTKKQLFNLNESVFRTQVSILTDSNLDLSAREADKVRQAYKFNSLYSSMGSTWSNSSKVPRKNLFTLENLKTPKDFSETESESNLKDRDRKMNKKIKQVLKQDDFSQRASMKKLSFDSVSGGSDDSNLAKKHADSLFSADGFKVLSDTTAESSEDEFVSCDDIKNSKTDSSQMSRLGKVKSEEIETEEKVEENKPVSPDFKNKKNAGSDLKMRLTSILQSKNLKQKQDKLSDEASEPFNQTLHIDVTNSDSEVFMSDSNTDFASPEAQPRNLFDKFEMKKNFSATTDLSSPDCERNKNSKSFSRRRKHRKGVSTHKRKYPHFTNSPSDQSTLSSNSIKQEPVMPAECDSRMAVADCSNLLKEETNKDITSEVSKSGHHDKEGRHHRISKRSKSKKRSRRSKSHADPNDQSVSDEKSLFTSSPRKSPKMSPSPRVDPTNAYATVDGDIYVPSGKIQVTERTIVLDSPKEEKNRFQGKLRLKKQTNSPIKGGYRYEVINNEFSEIQDSLFRTDKDIDTKDTDACTNKAKESDYMVSHQESNPQDDTSHHKLREKNRKWDTKHKLLSDSVDNVEKLKNDSLIEENTGKNTHPVIEKSSPEREKTSRRSLRSFTVKSVEPGYSSDENFVPSTEMSKSPVGEKSQRFHKQRSSRRLHNDSEDGESGLMNLSSHHRKFPSSPMSRKAKPFPNKPELNNLLDSSKLIVKESVKRQVGDHLSRMLKSRGRWGGCNSVNQLTLDTFVKPMKKHDNLFAEMESKSESGDAIESSVQSLGLRSSLRQSNFAANSEKTVDSQVSSSLSLNIPANGNVFGTHSPCKSGLERYRNTGQLQSNSPNKAKSSREDKKGELMLGNEGLSATSQASCTDASSKSPLREDLKSSSQCEQNLNDGLDVNSLNYRAHSPLSSEGSDFSCKNAMADSRESTPRRTSRNRTTDHSQSPLASGRLRNRDGLKSSPYKAS